MWVVIVLQIFSSAPLQGSYQPIVYDGVVMQEFSSKESCENAAKKVSELDDRRNQGDKKFEIRSGIIAMECVKK